MSQHRAVRQRPPEGRLWAPDSQARPTSRDQGVREEAGRTGGRAIWERTLGERALRDRNPRDKNQGDKAQRDRVQRDDRRPNIATAEAVIGGGPLTTAGVSFVLGVACLIGGLIDLLLVGTAAWAITGLFLAATVYAALRVHRQGWYSAVVGPPLAFALGLALIALFSPHDMGSGLIGAGTTMLELLADKARAVFFGTAAALVIVLVRRLPFNR